MLDYYRKYWPLLAILIISLTTHFVFFGYPNETVFDEVHFGKFISGYFTHEYFFDIHPPLGKLLISAVGWASQFNPDISFAQIGEKFPDNQYLALRFLPTFTGALIPLILYLLACELGFSRISAFTLGLIMSFENAFIVQSRFILLDAFLIFFGFLALYLYALYYKRKHLGFLLSSYICAALAVSVKWTGLSFLALIAILQLYTLVKDRLNARIWLISLLGFLIIPSLIYLGVSVIHLQILNHAGPGDAFMSPQFQKTLVDNVKSNDPDIKPLSLIYKIVELNAEMYRANSRLTASHDYGSKWYTWPFLQRPIYYWHEPAENNTDARIYFLGNPVIWFLSTVAIVGLLLEIITRFILRKQIPKIVLLIVGGYALNILPFIGIHRVMFLYHYLIAYVFAVFALLFLVNTTKHKALFCALLIAGSVAGFLFFAALTYGVPLSAAAYQHRVWLPSWM